MINNTSNIKTFIRLDTQLLDLMLKHINTAVVVGDHWIIATLKYTATNAADVQAWLAAQPADCHGMTQPQYGRDRIIVGFSLSKLGYDDLYRLAKTNTCKIMKHRTHQYNLKSYKPTANPFLLLNESETYFYMVKRHEPEVIQLPVEIPEDIPSTNLLPVEKQFMDSLEGHDFWYSYSDSLSVYKAGEHRREILICNGVKLGLTQRRVVELYNLKYKQLTP